MLEEMTPEDMDGWIAKHRIMPIGLEKVCWTIATAAAQICYRLNIIAAGTSSAKDLPVLNPPDFVPWKVKKKKSKDDYVSPNAMVAAVRMAVNR
jgi:hypothetical protein